jgi:hypothetical protein
MRGALRLAVGDDDERPRLLMRTRRRGAGNLDRIPDQLERDGIVREEANRAAGAHQVEERA